MSYHYIMNYEILQFFLLTAYGKAYLEGKNVTFEKNHPGAYNHRNIRFVEKLPKDQLLPQDIIAKTPNEWFKYLKDENFIHLHLTYQPSKNIFSKDEFKSIFKGYGNPWFLIAEKEDICEIWKSEWIGEQGELMSYYYPIVKDFYFGKVSFPSLDTTKLYLKEILSDLIDFTKNNKLDNWMKAFSNAMSYLSVTDASKLLEKDYLPADCYDLEAEQILAAVDHA